MRIPSKWLYIGIILIGLLPTIGVFSWGVYTAVERSSVPFTRPFTDMK